MSSPAPYSRDRPLILFAHRGASAQARENTLEAFDLALELGATGLESDVWVTADGLAVLDHDGFADAAGTVPIDTVLRADLPGHIPSLDDLYEHCGTAFELSLDVKDPNALPPALASARAAAAADRLWCCHHRWRVLAEWRPVAADVRLVDSTYLGFMSGGPAERFGRLVAAGVDAVNLHHSEWTDDLRALAASHGLATLAWDAQRPEEIERIASLGIDGVFSDHVDRMVAAAAPR